MKVEECAFVFPETFDQQESWAGEVGGIIKSVEYDLNYQIDIKG